MCRNANISLCSTPQGFGEDFFGFGVDNPEAEQDDFFDGFGGFGDVHFESQTTQGVSTLNMCVLLYWSIRLVHVKIIISKSLHFVYIAKHLMKILHY